MERDDWKKYQNDFSGGQQFSPEQQYGGTPLQPGQTEQYQQPRQPVIIVGEPERDKKETSNLAVSSLVLGILTLVFFWVPYLAIITGIIAVIQGIINVAQHRAGQGMAVAGIVTGALGVLISLFLVFLFLVGLSMYYGW